MYHEKWLGIDKRERQTSKEVTAVVQENRVGDEAKQADLEVKAQSTAREDAQVGDHSPPVLLSSKGILVSLWISLSGPRKPCRWSWQQKVQKEF